MKKGMKIAALLSALLFALGGAVLAEYGAPDGNPYVMDAANVLSVETEVFIEESNAELYAAHAAQIVVVTVDTTYPLDIMTFAELMFEEWELYASSLERGMLLLLSIEDDDYALLSGRDLERYLNDGTLTEYADAFLEDDFAAGDYDAGTQKLLGALCGLIDSIYSDGAVPHPDQPGSPFDPYAPDAPTDPHRPYFNDYEYDDIFYPV